MQHKMHMADLHHSSPGFNMALVVLAVPAVPTMPGMRTFPHPAFRQRCKAFRALGTRCDFDAPPRTMGRPPRGKRVGVVLRIRTNRGETRDIPRRDVGEQGLSCCPLIEPALGMSTASNKSTVSTSRCRLRPVIFLPPSSPRSAPPISVVLTAWLSMPAALGVGSRPAAPRVCSRKAVTHRVQVPSSRH